MQGWFTSRTGAVCRSRDALLGCFGGVDAAGSPGAPLGPGSPIAAPLPRREDVGAPAVGAVAHDVAVTAVGGAERSPGLGAAGALRSRPLAARRWVGGVGGAAGHHGLPCRCRLLGCAVAGLQGSPAARGAVQLQVREFDGRGADGIQQENEASGGGRQYKGGADQEHDSSAGLEVGGCDLGAVQVGLPWVELGGSPTKDGAARGCPAPAILHGDRGGVNDRGGSGPAQRTPIQRKRPANPVPPAPLLRGAGAWEPCMARPSCRTWSPGVLPRLCVSGPPSPRGPYLPFPAFPARPGRRRRSRCSPMDPV